jgi:hypothetical protein
MVDKVLLQPVVTTPQSEDPAGLERNAAIVILKTFGNWMLCTFVPLPTMHGKVSKARSPGDVRGTSFDFGA